jgi:pyruvoyl-dependent arginine decarboxylase
MERMRSQKWFDPVAVVLSAGSGWSDTSELGAFDAALHDGEGAGLASINLMAVTSIIPPGVPAYRMKEGIVPVDAEGLHAPAVFRSIGTQGTAHVSAGIGIGIPVDPSRSGAIFHHASHVSGDDLARQLEVMVTEGMDRIRGGGKWHFRHAIATSVPDPDRPHRHRSAVAVLMFMDNYSMPMYENVIEPVL